MDRDFRYSDSWLKDELTGKKNEEINRFALPAEKLARTSLSGYERNKLFISQQATQFHDLSGISATDSICDARGFALWDYDRDGWQDIALINVNAPVLELFRNNMATFSNRSPAGMLAVRCIGGQKSAVANPEFSPRDGIGAKIFVKLADTTLFRELHCGEGFGVQNSNTLVFGLGSAENADVIEIRWPSGKRQTIDGVAEGSLVTVFEDPADGGENGFAVEPYRKNVDARSLTVTPVPTDKMDLHGQANLVSDLVMYTSMATWCTSCKEHLPDLQQLRKKFDPDQLAMFGVPVDVADDATELQQYQQDFQPAYRILDQLNESQRNRYQDYIMERLKTEALPTTIITNRAGEILHVQTGLPSISQIKLMMNQLSP